MSQELFSVLERFQRIELLPLGTAQRKLNMRMAKIGRKMDLGNRDRADTRVGQFVADQLFQFLAKALGNTFVTMGVQISE